MIRARVTLLQERSREMQRVEKLLEDACVKLSAVVSDLAGASSRAILAALIAGVEDPSMLAELAKGRMRSKVPALQAALRGRIDDHHRFMIGFRLARVDQISADLLRPRSTD